MVNLRKKNGYKFVVDSSNESLPFDWYNVYFELDFQITETTGNTNYAAENAVAVVNGAFPLINQLKVDFNGANVLDTPGINHAFNVKNLTEFSKDYSEKRWTLSFHNVDTTIHADFTHYTMRRVEHVCNDADDVMKLVMLFMVLMQITMKNLLRERCLSLLVLKQVLMWSYRFIDFIFSILFSIK